MTHPPDTCPSSGSAAYAFDWGTREVVHADGRRWWLSPRLERFYATLDANRGRALTAAQLLEAVWDDPIKDESNVRLAVWTLRRQCGREVVETTPLSIPRHGGPMRCGYRVS